jgi:hypothetical protein
VERQRAEGGTGCVSQQSWIARRLAAFTPQLAHVRAEGGRWNVVSRTPTVLALGLSSPVGTLAQELRKLHGRTLGCFQLTLHRPLILAKEISRLVRFHMAALDINQDFDFPRLQVVANRAPLYFRHQAPKSVEHELLLNQIVGVHPTTASPQVGEKFSGNPPIAGALDVGKRPWCLPYLTADTLGGVHLEAGKPAAAGAGRARRGIA